MSPHHPHHHRENSIPEGDVPFVPKELREEWRPAPSFEGRYEVSSFGRVRTLPSLKVLSVNPDKDGYPRVSLRRERDGRAAAQHVHRLVCRAFHGESRPVHREVAHLDGSRTNARADNLKWVSRVENTWHKRSHGTHQAGARHPRAKLTEEAVLEIRATTGRRGAIAAKYGISLETVTDIRTGRRWGHLRSSRGAAFTNEGE